ncbi:MAG: tripartite tricarboxylate transporter substrate binding protein [Bradyrhizobium sp.]
MQRLLVAAVLAASTFFLSQTPSRAEFPDRPMKIVVAWPPGGSTDIVGRFLAEQLSIAFKRSVVVENRPGANGNIGTQSVIKSPADGYTLQIATAETHAINPHVYKNAGYEVTKDFEPIALVARVNFVLTTKGDFPANDLKQFLELARAQPGKYTVASYGIGSTSHMALAAFEEKTGTNYLHVPYKGVAPAVNAILTGEVDAAFVSPNSVVGLEKSGQAKILGSASLKRQSPAPNVPTFSELGVPDFVTGNWYGLVAPAGIPDDAKKRLQEEVRKIATSEQFVTRANAAAIDVDYRDADEFAKYLKSENDRWQQIVAARKIEVAQ